MDSWPLHQVLQAKNKNNNTMQHVTHDRGSKTTSLGPFPSARSRREPPSAAERSRLVSREEKKRSEKIHLRTFLALSPSIPLKNCYPVCFDSWDRGAGSSHSAQQSALHYKHVGDMKDKTKKLFAVQEKQEVCLVPTKSK